MKDVVQPTAPLYPTIPTEGDGHAYRLQQITRIQTELTREAEKRASLCKKYKRGVNVVDGADAALTAVGAGLGIGGVYLISVAIPVAIGLEISSLGCAGLCVIGKVVGRKLTSKYVKHQSIEMMARAKLNTISDIVSKALADGNMSDVEYRLVLDEMQKFQNLRKEFRTNKATSQESIDELRKKILSEEEEEKLRELIKKLNSQ